MKMDIEKICLASKTIDIAEHDTYIELTNRLCYYDDKNLNNVLLPYQGVEESAKAMASTLVNMPVQARYKKVRGQDDLGSHEMSVDKDGNVVFGTESIGVHTSAWISEPEDVTTVSGETKKLPCLYATARIWKRYSNVVSAIKRLFSSENGLNSSWEIATNKYEYANGVKKLTDYEFIGNTLLGSLVQPAYRGTSKTVSMTAEISNNELIVAEALSQDIIENSAFDINKNPRKENGTLDKDNENVSSSVEETTVQEEKTDMTDTSDISELNQEETMVENENADSDMSENQENMELSALTDHDLIVKIDMACSEKIQAIDRFAWCYVAFWFPEDKTVWCECSNRKSDLDYMKFTYTVSNEEVNVSDGEWVTLTVEPKKINETVAQYEKQIAEKDETILKVSSEITNLKSQISELSTYKEKFEKSEQERIEAELAEKKEQLISSVVKSGQVTRDEIEKSEEMTGYVNALDKKSLMAIVGERLLSSISQEANIEVSQAKEDLHISTNLNTVDEIELSKSDKASIMKNYLRK